MRPRSSSSSRLLAGAATATLALGLLAPPGASAAPGPAPDRAEVSDFLGTELAELTGTTTVMVHGTDLAAADAAVEAAGLTKRTEFAKIGVVVAKGSKAQIEAVRTEPGVAYVEGAMQPVELTGDTSHTATRGLEAQRSLTGADGSRLTGKGVSVGVIDSGVDPTHPSFREKDGGKVVVANLKALCDPLEVACTVQRVPDVLDTDTAVGGHGTHVSGIVAGRPVALTSGETVQGAATGAKVVSISTGAVLFVIGADQALNWVLENHQAPCGEGVPAAVCPPIKVTNNSYGPSGGGELDPSSATVKLQRALAAEGVMTIWANGNDGGDGSTLLTNPPAQDQTPGIMGVASFFDKDTGTRDGVVSEFSSRGLQGQRDTYPDISAPGGAITSSCRPYLPICATGLDFRNGPSALDVGTFNTISGTSMAAPHIAGIAAQLFQAEPAATVGEVEQALKTTAYQFSDGAPYTDGTSVDKGHGLVDVVAAADALTGP